MSWVSNGSYILRLMDKGVITYIGNANRRGVLSWSSHYSQRYCLSRYRI